MQTLCDTTLVYVDVQLFHFLRCGYLLQRIICIVIESDFNLLLRRVYLAFLKLIQFLVLILGQHVEFPLVPEDLHAVVDNLELVRGHPPPHYERQLYVVFCGDAL